MQQTSVFSPASKRAPRITQWIVGKDNSGNVDYRSLLLPLLAWQTHHNNGRWITWVASRFIDKYTLESYSVKLTSLRMIVDSQSTHSSFRLVLTALRNQKSEMVIASLPPVSKQEMADLEAAAESGNCTCLILIHE